MIDYYTDAEMGMDDYSRNTSEYIRSISNEKLKEIESVTHLAELKAVFGHSRYFKVNPLSLTEHGTIEIRHHKGTVDPDTIYDWMQTIGKMLQIAENKVKVRGGVDKSEAVTEEDKVKSFVKRLESARSSRNEESKNVGDVDQSEAVKEKHEGNSFVEYYIESSKSRKDKENPGYNEVRCGIGAYGARQKLRERKQELIPIPRA